MCDEQTFIIRSAPDNPIGLMAQNEILFAFNLWTKRLKAHQIAGAPHSEYLAPTTPGRVLKPWNDATYTRLENMWAAFMTYKRLPLLPHFKKDLFLKLIENIGYLNPQQSDMEDVGDPEEVDTLNEVGDDPDRAPVDGGIFEPHGSKYYGAQVKDPETGELINKPLYEKVRADNPDTVGVWESEKYTVPIWGVVKAWGLKDGTVTRLAWLPQSTPWMGKNAYGGKDHIMDAHMAECPVGPWVPQEQTDLDQHDFEYYYGITDIEVAGDFILAVVNSRDPVTGSSMIAFPPKPGAKPGFIVVEYAITEEIAERFNLKEWENGPPNLRVVYYESDLHIHSAFPRGAHSTYYTES